MKAKYAISVSVLGILIALVGRLFRILHWDGSYILLLIGLLLVGIGVSLLQFRLPNKPKTEDILDL